MAKLRVVVICSYAPSLINFRGHLIRAMMRRNILVTALSPASRDEEERVKIALGCRFASITLSRSSLAPTGGLWSLCEILYRILCLRPDAIFTYTAKPVILGGLCARMLGVPFTAMITGLGYGFVSGRSCLRAIMALLYRVSLAGARTVIFQNQDDADYFSGECICPRARRVIVPGSGVDLLKFAYSPATGPLSFLLVARLLADKGVREFIAAARIIRAESPGVRFIIVGPHDSNPSAITSREVDQWIAEGIVEWRGPVDDVRSHLRECSVFVLPSYREGMPRSVLEAMAVGRPIITTDAPGCRETVVHGDNGFLVPVRDAVALAEAMRRFIAVPDLVTTMGARSRKIAEARFDVHSVNARMMISLGLASR